jgi:hypothetical protein
MIGAGTFAPERVATVAVDPKLVMMVIEDVTARPVPEAQDGIELFATCAAAYADYMGIEAAPGDDAFEEEDIVVIAALASRVTALSGLTEAGHLDHRMAREDVDDLAAVALAASRTTLLHRGGVPTFQLLEFLAQLERADREDGTW